MTAASTVTCKYATEVTNYNNIGLYGTDVIWMGGNGTPVDGTSGSGVGIAGIGSLFTDYTNANLYINAGTKASPTWKLVTKAA